MAIWKCRICKRLIVREAPHEVLGLDKDADFQTIKTRYREIVRETHPDARGDAEKVDLFRRATEAYRELKEEKEECQGKIKKTTPSAVDVYQKGKTCPGCGRK